MEEKCETKEFLQFSDSYMTFKFTKKILFLNFAWFELSQKTTCPVNKKTNVDWVLSLY